MMMMMVILWITVFFIIDDYGMLWLLSYSYSVLLSYHILVRIVCGFKSFEAASPLQTCLGTPVIPSTIRCTQFAVLSRFVSKRGFVFFDETCGGDCSFW